MEDKEEDGKSRPENHGKDENKEEKHGKDEAVIKKVEPSIRKYNFL
jgi:hypothetical protein